jgi:hypothetical protein
MILRSSYRRVGLPEHLKVDDDIELLVLAWQQHSDWINVKTCCGVVGDGIHDDTAAINHCMSMAPPGLWSDSVAGPTVYFSPRTYTIGDRYADCWHKELL